MQKSLEAHSQDFDFIGGQQFMSMTEKAGYNELCTVFYFQSMAGVQRFAHSGEHMKGWLWWAEHGEKYPSLGMYADIWLVEG